MSMMVKKYVLYGKVVTIILCIGLFFATLLRLLYPLYSKKHYYPKDSFRFPKDIIRPTPTDAPIHIPILMYHYVEYVKDKGDRIRIGLNIPRNIFEEQIKTLVEASYSAIFMNDVADALDGKVTLPQKPVVLTFDDGYGDFYTDVFPILKKYNIKAVNYVISEVLGKKNYMTREQVQEIDKSGLVEVASHTTSHVNLKLVPLSVARKEIFQSKIDLEELVGHTVFNFAYPYGAFTASVAGYVKEAQYRTAVTVLPGTWHHEQDRYYLERIRPGYNTGNTLLKLLEKEDKK
ncbi:polysaccharide deacetylase family protein [Candidatus Gottesmanbacteria bacterium]|nr:polysaccharide deacetylase family protein [Candidatus Gottesmanbacteria bacterium]